MTNPPDIHVKVYFDFTSKCQAFIPLAENCILMTSEDRQLADFRVVGRAGPNFHGENQICDGWEIFAFR